MTSVEILTAEPAIPRAIASLQALTHYAPPQYRVSQTRIYEGRCDWLLVWGPGEPVRAAAIKRQVATGRHAIAIDLAYWSRHRKVRISIDGPHPQAWVMRRDLPTFRLERDRPEMAEVWREHGPVIVAGIGKKAQKQYNGDGRVDAWESQMAAECAARWPERQVIRRPKKPVTIALERVLKGASLLVTWHSNAAIDAIRYGIPAVCKDGAAAAVCPSEVPDRPDPLPATVRDRFLANLAWFQWDLSGEAKDCWAFLGETLS